MRDTALAPESAADLALRQEISSGLQQACPVISPKFLYDDMGSRLFEAICLLPEYYLTRTEARIFSRHQDEILSALGQDICLIEPGAGSCEKAQKLLQAGLAAWQYVALDISADFLQQAASRLRQHFPQLEVMAHSMDFSREFELPAQAQTARRVFFYPGSSIGNFMPEQAVDLMGRMRDAMDEDGGLLIGVDMKKPKRILDAAYDDAMGLTAAFNLNLLRNVNRILEADFDLREWQHQGFYNVAQGRVEMHLAAKHELLAQWPGGARRFERGESIHTENSYKYTLDEFAALLKRASFAVKQVWQDEDAWFSVIYAKPV
ncbi:L-histidine N(alpha)-methyltransferase [Massilia sp. W12]|uniref:L-histidine N(alpha)-methyltransferase n=1 Tax=Massilia sp. W12 TaxID=3126507 RepID=UPI0030CB1E49